MYGRWSVSFQGHLSQDAEAALAEAGIVTAADVGPDDASTVWVRAASPTEAIDWVRDEVVAYGSFSDFKAARVLAPIRMTLLENAYDFLNESLRSTIRAESEPRAWKFAVFDVAQAIELLLKARLEAEHPVLVYQDVDSRRSTVSMRQAIERIQNAAKIQLTERERRSLERRRIGGTESCIMSSSCLPTRLRASMRSSTSSLSGSTTSTPSSAFCTTT